MRSCDMLLHVVERKITSSHLSSLMHLIVVGTNQSNRKITNICSCVRASSTLILLVRACMLAVRDNNAQERWTEEGVVVVRPLHLTRPTTSDAKYRLFGRATCIHSCPCLSIFMIISNIRQAGMQDDDSFRRRGPSAPTHDTEPLQKGNIHYYQQVAKYGWIPTFLGVYCVRVCLSVAPFVMSRPGIVCRALCELPPRGNCRSDRNNQTQKQIISISTLTW
jgi:hypothetical protein